MKRSFTKLTFTALSLAFLVTGIEARAQDTTKTTGAKADSAVAVAPAPAPAPAPTVAHAHVLADTTWVPQRRLWGYTFGDLYYAGHTDQNTGARGSESNYAGVPTYRNAFQFRRLYLGYDYEITRKFKAEVLLATEPNANTGAAAGTSIQNSDNLVDAKMGFWIKNFNLRVRDLWTGTDLVIGEMSTPGFALNEPGTNAPVSLSEATWGYRSIEKTITDFHKNNSYDLGAALQGTFDPKTKNFGYVLMVGNNSQASLLSASNPNTGFYKIFYGDIWGKFFNQHLYIDLYADYAKTASATDLIGGQEHNMAKLFVAYVSHPFNFGVEAYAQHFMNGVTDKTTKLNSDANVKGISFWVRGPIGKKLNYYARYDSYNPFTDYIGTDAYSANTNYGAYNPTNKEQFYTFGLDYNPTKNVHFEPNVWLLDFKDQRAAGTAGYVANDHTIVYRMTFFFTFGK